MPPMCATTTMSRTSSTGSGSTSTWSIPAYFKTGAEDLDTAQEQKLDHLCRKLRLESGDRLLDIGCGWGGLVCWAATHYGVDAVGVTLSERQVEEARRRVAEQGLSEQAEIRCQD